MIIAERLSNLTVALIGKNADNILLFCTTCFLYENSTQNVLSHSTL